MVRTGVPVKYRSEIWMVFSGSLAEVCTPAYRATLQDELEYCVFKARFFQFNHCRLYTKLNPLKPL